MAKVWIVKVIRDNNPALPWYIAGLSRSRAGAEKIKRRIARRRHAVKHDGIGKGIIVLGLLEGELEPWLG